jgi:hypothetical protein
MKSRQQRKKAWHSKNGARPEAVFLTIVLAGFRFAVLA